MSTWRVYGGTRTASTSTTAPPARAAGSGVGEREGFDIEIIHSMLVATAVFRESRLAYKSALGQAAHASLPVVTGPPVLTD
ncbi:hypothetical protein [Nonomuraea insulae]|uniref:Uncharacterized protein n=1 Tax=Nonomuraea insulae TaxID=1616787 RepID=A0ABW1CK69_9ACTN